MPSRTASHGREASSASSLPKRPLGVPTSEAAAGARSLLKNPFQRRRRAMFIELARNKQVAPQERHMPANEAYMPLLRSLSFFFPGFYRHVAPTALRIGFRVFGVFQQAANREYPDYAAAPQG